MKRRDQWLIIVGVMTLVFDGCCCGGLYTFYQSLLDHVETYKPTALPIFKGTPVKLRVHPGTRVGNRLFGPPFECSLSIYEDAENLVLGRLLSAEVLRDDGSIVTAEVNRPEREPSHGAVGLYGNFRHGGWGERPTFIASVELVYTDGTVRKKIEIPLRRHVDSSIYIP